MQKKFSRKGGNEVEKKYILAKARKNLSKKVVIR